MAPGTLQHKLALQKLANWNLIENLGIISLKSGDDSYMKEMWDKDTKFLRKIDKKKKNPVLAKSPNTGFCEPFQPATKQ